MNGEEQVSFQGFHGDALSGVLHRPESASIGGLLLAHCFTCSKDFRSTVRLAKGLAAEGFTVVRFDFTGLGDSGGEFESSTFVANVGDLTRAALWMIEQGLGPCGMIGHSLGGAATLISATQVKGLRSVAVIGAPSSAAHVRHLIDDEATATAGIEGCAVAAIGGRPFPISRQFLTDLEHYDEERRIASLEQPLLVMHSPTDTTVDVSEGERIFELATQPKSFIPLMGADHLLTGATDAATAVAHLAAWFRTTLS